MPNPRRILAGLTVAALIALFAWATVIGVWGERWVGRESARRHLAVLRLRHALGETIPSTSNVLIDLRAVGNVHVYLPRPVFEEIPYPQRGDAIDYLGRVWCDGVRDGLLPTMKIRDIRTGAVLARYSCFWHSGLLRSRREIQPLIRPTPAPPELGSGFDASSPDVTPFPR